MIVENRIRFEKALPVIQQLKQQGYEAYFVGGAVRDYILGRSVYDIDITTSASPKEVMHLFRETIPVGIEHGTVIVRYNEENYEVTTFRKDEMYEDYRHPKGIQFVRSLEEDLKRRDFTMNALAMTDEFTIIDLFQGKKDINNQVIKTVGCAEKRFQEDALRIMRAFRFMSQLCFSLSAKTKVAIMKERKNLTFISVERIVQEMDKLWLGPCVNEALYEMESCDIISLLPGCTFVGEKRKILQSYRFDKCETVEQSWALYIHVLKVQDVEAFLRAYKFSRQRMKKILVLKEGLALYQMGGLSDYDRFRLSEEHLFDIVRLHAIISNKNINEELTREKEKYNQLPIKHIQSLAITPKEMMDHLKQKPGSWIRHLQKEIVQAILKGEVENDRTSLKEWMNHWHQQ